MPRLDKQSKGKINETKQRQDKINKAMPRLDKQSKGKTNETKQRQD